MKNNVLQVGDSNFTDLKIQNMNTELALKVNKFIHEQCVDGVPHDIGWDVVKLFCQPAVSGRSEQLKCGKEQCTCYGLQEAQNCDKDCENPIW